MLVTFERPLPFGRGSERSAIREHRRARPTVYRGPYRVDGAPAGKLSVGVFDIERDGFPHANESFDTVLCLEVLEHLAVGHKTSTCVDRRLDWLYFDAAEFKNEQRTQPTSTPLPAASLHRTT